MEKGKLIFVTGGVRSGKSSFAEELATNWSRDLDVNLHYIACGVPSDKEMRERIARHQENRSGASGNFQTWECPYNLQRISSHFSKQDILVLDCVTTLLNNYLFHQNIDDPSGLMDRMLTDIFSLQKASGGLVVVSNEVMQDVPHQASLTRKYQYIIGIVHQNIVDQADTAYLVESGIPICKKGVAV
ncbi:adenosylcobinamide kinase/adenosylcobinamide-phosphate guanylyltransferase [Virgibacillus natechei]|uniref:Adenosylcobinamide kinase n=1 Tax=Virgibacillus natechei TaxID=1216297 RepID=A0ABS4IG92_9BACI|nr:bifunctional adenosylcobinamide kinase/adenosylcobinamide-phosphate guanylyltransferase [Virgibacillus natechei]MBP1969970.1 adenosylcobinamide kinase/adenosylcobinamide-phosphate guanylyltransferase [Virgibacillus natechei]UZD13370.1 bifunctional adenosylcobinamide kinase/adenosylcobinamide-phosphate guanylyltransferase [Virgibacillus natechei]